MNHSYQALEFDAIIEQLVELASTEKAKERFRRLEPMLSEQELRHELKETSEARLILDKMGNPPSVILEDTEQLLRLADQGGCLMPEQLESISMVLTGVKRLKDFLQRCKHLECSLPYYELQLEPLEEIREELNQKIRGGRVDDYASRLLRDLRAEITKTEEKMRQKADALLKNQKECFSERFTCMRSGHICLPVKKEYKFKISGSVIDKSSTGATLFIEPTQVAKLGAELGNLRIDQENEERRILYELSGLVAEQMEVFSQNTAVMEKLDYIFAKGKLSAQMQGTEPGINTERMIRIQNGRHPFLLPDQCVPLQFEMNIDRKGVLITGPNTGGKTVAIKTVGLFCLMAQCGLHVPCEAGNFAMNNQVLCDIGDGQNITENLSTFSAHVTRVLDILKRADGESLVILDELGSGTDPTEGMGIAVAILEELRKSGCLYVVTTHYPQVKEYAEKTEGVINARMGFDRESLRPLYRLEIGEAGESCALYIAKRLGMPDSMLKAAGLAAYGKEPEELYSGTEDWQRVKVPHICKKKENKANQWISEKFSIGDSVMILPEKKLGIVCKTPDEKGIVVVQMPEGKININHKRVKLHVKADQLYPEDYDFSILFDTVENRKARHQMEKHHVDGLQIEY